MLKDHYPLITGIMDIVLKFSNILLVLVGNSKVKSNARETSSQLFSSEDEGWSLVFNKLIGTNFAVIIFSPSQA
jgi:hypothetical protein